MSSVIDNVSSNKNSIWRFLLFGGKTGGVVGCGGGGGGGGKKEANDEIPEETVERTVIVPPPNGGSYHGAFLYTSDGLPTPAAIENFKNMVDENLDLVMWFISFKYNPNLNFPISDCEEVYQSGAAPFIKLEPWDPTNRSDDTYSLENILSGNFDEELENFATGAINWGKPNFVTFGHEMNGYWYPWSGYFHGGGEDSNQNGIPDGPETYVEAFQYVVNKITYEYGATNITWVLNVNGDTLPDEEWNKPYNYYPEDKFVDWICITKLNTEDYGAPWQSLKDLIGPMVLDLSVYGKSLMVAETGCDENDDRDSYERKPQWIYEMIDWLANYNLLSAFVYFNANKFEDSAAKNYALNNSSQIDAYKQAMDKNGNAFSSGIVTEIIQNPK